MFRLGMSSKRAWRPLMGVLVAYAVAIQSLLITLGEFAPPAHVNAGPSTFELCHYDGQENFQGAPELPAGNPDHTGCTLCILCLAGSYHAVIGASPAISNLTEVEIVVARSLAGRQPLPRARAHSIASPRGPPLGA